MHPPRVKTACMAIWLGAVSLAGTAALAPAFAAATLATKIPTIVETHAAAFAGAPSPDRVLHLVLSLPLRNTAELDRLLASIDDPASPEFRHYLNVEEFAARFGPEPADYQAVANFLAAKGLTVTHLTTNRMLIDFDAKVADVERVFNVKMGLYKHPTENRLFISPDRAPTLDLTVPVQQIIGLDDFVLPTRKFVHHDLASGPRNGSGPGGQFDGNDIHRAYYPSGTLTGTGQSVGLMELAGLNVSDVALFFSNKYGPANSVPIKLISTDGAPVTCGSSCGDDSEQALDVEYAISVAPGLASVRVYVGNTAEDVLNSMATDNISKVLSTSWGWNENFATDDALFKEFAAQGQTNLTASGDYSSLSASGPWPEEDANIIAVGGTDLAMTSGGAKWSGETGWNGSAGGPSLDKTIKVESYQLPYINSANGGSKTLRNVPDIAASANTNMEICANGGCNGGNGGTSFASPIWAGFIALANQYAVSKGKPVLGFINPAIYALGRTTSYKTTLHDQTTGKSGKYSCTVSYDLVTGLGSPAGAALINALVP
jgi:subtilase family serine protease